MIGRGFRIAAGLLTAFTIGCVNTATPPAGASMAAPATTTITLSAADGRLVDVMVVAPAEPRGVILFSHGGGSSPGVTRALFDTWAVRGFAVLAPTHTDSLTIAADRRTTMQAALATRVADMRLAATHAIKAYPNLPLAEVGYSYGSLTALIGGGALSAIVPGSIPGVKAVVMFSSPGPIPGLTSAPGAFAGVAVPTLLITGSADTVPGFVTDAAQHLTYFEALPAGKRTALIVKHANHEFIRGDQPGWGEVSAIVEDFLAAQVFEETVPSARFSAAVSTAHVEIRRR